MKKKAPSQKTGADERIVQLVGTILEAEKELQALTGGQLDAVVGEGDAPYLLRDAQAKLRVSEAAQRALAETQIGILNALPAHIALLDFNGVILAVNEAWRRFASANVLQSTDFFVGQNYLGVCESSQGECAEEAQEVAAGIRKVLSGELKDLALEYPCHSPTEKRWFRLMVTPLSDTPGTGAVVMHINVTERRQAEEDLRQKELEQRRLAEELIIETRRLHESQAAASIGSWETDLATLEVNWTEETFRIFETSPDQFTPTHQGFLQRVHPEDRRRVEDAFKSSIGRPGPFAVEHRLLFPEGRIKHVEERWQTFNDATGRPVRAVGTCQDITQRKAAEEVVQTRARQQETIAGIGFEATRATTLQEVFDFATRAVAGALGVELCKVLQLAPDGSHLRLVSGVGWQPGLIGVATVGVDRESQAGFTLKSEAAIYVNDFSREVRFKAPPLLRDHAVMSGLSVKIMLRDKPWGVLGAHCRTARNFNDVDAGFMQAVAGLLAIVIERLAVERTLSRSEARMRDAQRIAQLGNWELDLAKNELIWSEEIYRIFGVERPAFAGTYESFLAFVHPEDRQAMQSAQQTAVSGQGLLDLEHRIIRPDGVIRHVRERGELIHDESGRPVALSGTILDITDLRAAQSRVERMNSVLTEAQRIADMGSWDMDFTRGSLLWSEETCRLFGVRPEEFGGTYEAFTAFILPEDRAAYSAVHASITPAAPVLEAEYRIRRPDGAVRWMFERGRVTFDGQGKAIRRLGVVADVTERRQREEQLRLLETCVSRLNDIVLITEAEPIDEPGPRILYVNDAFVRRTGFTREEAIGKTPRLLQGPKTQRDALDLIRAALKAWKPCRVELINYTKSGEEFWIELDVVPVADATGWFTHWIAVERDITERKRAEADLREKEERFRLMVEGSEQVVFYTHDREHRFNYVSPSAREVLGYEPGELVGQPCDLLVITDDPVNADVHTLTDRALQDGRPCAPYLAVVRHKDGRRVVLEILESPVIREGEIIGIQGFARDITERRAAVERLRQSEQLLRIAGRIARLGAWSVDLPEVRIIWSDEVCAIHDLPVGTVPVLDQALAYYTPESRPVIEAAFSLCVSQGTPFDVELELLSATGKRKWVRSIGQAERDEAGGIRRVQGAFQDITEKKAAEERASKSVAELLASEERFRLLSKATNDAIWDWNLMTDELWWNEGYEHLFGRARTAIDRSIKSWTAYIHPEDRARVTEGVHEVIENGGTFWSGEYRFQCQDGHYAHVLDRGHIIRDAAGRPLRMIGGMTDLTKQKEYEIALFQSNRALMMLSRCNEALIRSETEGDLLAAICRIAVDIGGFRLAWVGYALDDARKTIACQSHAGIEDGYLAEARITWDERDPSGQGPAGRVIRDGKPVVISDLETDQSFRPWLEAARARGFRSVLDLPLRDSNRTFGVFVLFSSEVRQPLPDEIRLLQELADDMAFGIVHLRARSDQQRMHTAVERVAASVSAAAGTDFFAKLTHNMVAALGAAAGFVAKVLPGEPVTSRTIAVVVDNQITANFDYVLEGTPCENFLTSDTCVIPQQVARQFPLAATLTALGAEGFVGRRLDNAAGKFIGQLVVIFKEPLKDADFVVSTLQIFAARAAAELERQETDTRLLEQAALLDKAQDAILVRDLNHHITYWNHSAVRLYGWTAEEAVGRSERELLYAEPGSFDRAVEKLIAEGEWTGELRHKCKAGRILEIEGRWTLVRNAGGEPKTVLALHTNVTERRQHERLAQRSQRLESIGTLAGGIAHDLNNALAPVMMGVELLRTQYPAESQTLDTIMACTQRGADMVRQLLTFAKGAEGARVSIQTDRLIKEMEKLMKGSFPKNIRFVIQCDPKLPKVLGDATQLHQVLLNLCVNARDAMPYGGTLTLAATRQEVDATYASSVPDARAGTYVQLVVRDTGTGIPPEIIDRIFDPFFTTKGQDRGTGLGLSTVMGIIKGHGGFLQVQSQPGQGSTFTVFLPAAVAGSDTERLARAADPFHGQGETVLFVDDEAAIRETARAVLQRLKFKPLTATDGADAMMQVAHHGAELRAIITDLHMPHLDGLAFVRALRRMLPEIPVMVASGRMEDAVAEEFKTLGVTTRLDKPFAEAQLAAALKLLLAPK